MNEELKTYQYYLRDLVFLLKEDVSKSPDIKNISNDFEAGVKWGKVLVLDLMVKQADAFQINLEDIGFKDYEEWQKRNNCIT